ncbi:hypothetical protein L1987_52217 [Smallanthus sonchifolius]|uniref:Uncharacterized protein n=1 Tax=Smallanthus sonchifolius TaxID=185202 RepID=A0ACB9ET46_9ASTR|nr:hypothetical protein L1987_52217 [Smallanthus sonchifolius]
MYIKSKEGTKACSKSLRSKVQSFSPTYKPSHFSPSFTLPPYNLRRPPLPSPATMSSITNNHTRLSEPSITHFLLLISLLSSIYSAEAQPSPPPDDYQYARFSPSMAIIIIVLVAALFCMGFFSIYIRRCSDDGSSRRGGLSMRRAGRLAAASRGIDAEVLETFPTFAYSTVKGLKIGKGALECAVCLNEFEDEETIRLIPKCDHVFHAECIDAWLESHVTCPVCRSDLVPKPGEERKIASEMDIRINNNNSNININETTSLEEGNINTNTDVSIQLGNDVVDTAPVLNRVKSAKPPRSKSVRGSVLFEKFRSHSTGHSLVQNGEDTERFTLRLPEEVRKQVISNALLNRCGSTVRMAGEGSARKGYRTGEGSSKGRFYRRNGSLPSDRSVFSKAPSLLSRAFSVRSQKAVPADGGASTSDKIPLNNIGPKSDEPPV